MDILFGFPNKLGSVIEVGANTNVLILTMSREDNSMSNIRKHGSEVE